MDCLHNVNSDLVQEQDETDATFERKLVRSDPITVARYYIHRFQALKTLLKNDRSILGKISDYFFITEFQNRGSQHDNGLLWIENAPILDHSLDQEIVNFVDAHISTNILDLPKSLREAQRHRHRKSCKRRSRDCRFGFPRPPFPYTVVIRPLKTRNTTLTKTHKKHRKKIDEALLTLQDDNHLTFDSWLLELEMTKKEYIEAFQYTITQPTIFLRRTTQDIKTNNFNIELSKLWTANTDIQFILNAHGAASYCTSYMTKNENTITKAIKDTLKECVAQNANTLQRLQQVGNTIINSQQISSQQAAYIALSLPLSTTSRQFVFINTCPLENRTLLLKRKKALQKLEPMSDDIFFEDAIKKYAERPSFLCTLCLAEFATEYNFATKYPKKISNLRILRHVR